MRFTLRFTLATSFEDGLAVAEGRAIVEQAPRPDVRPQLLRGVSMTKWFSVGALAALGSVAACATALNDGVVDMSSSAGSANGGSNATVGAGGSSNPPAGAESGAPSSGSVSGASSGVAGSPTSGVAGSNSAAGSAAAGSPSGGSAGTSSSGGGAAGMGVAGAENTGPCASPKDVTGGKSGNLGTTGAACLRTKETFNTVGCSNFTGRTVKVNGMAATCDVKSTFAPAIDGYNYFDISAGAADYASIVWFTS